MRACTHKHFACLPRWYLTCLSLLSMDQRVHVLAFLVNRTCSYINFDYEEHQGKTMTSKAKKSGYAKTVFRHRDACMHMCVCMIVLFILFVQTRYTYICHRNIPVTRHELQRIPAPLCPYQGIAIAIISLPCWQVGSSGHR